MISKSKSLILKFQFLTCKHKILDNPDKDEKVHKNIQNEETIYCTVAHVTGSLVLCLLLVYHNISHSIYKA